MAAFTTKESYPTGATRLFLAWLGRGRGFVKEGIEDIPADKADAMGHPRCECRKKSTGICLRSDKEQKANVLDVLNIDAGVKRPSKRVCNLSSRFNKFDWDGLPIFGDNIQSSFNLIRPPSKNACQKRRG